MPWFDWRRLVGLYGPDTSNSSGIGPDFPGSSGDRERGRHRPSGYPRLTQTAVCNDDGSPILGGTEEKLDALLAEIRALRVGMVLKGTAEDIAPDESD